MAARNTSKTTAPAPTEDDEAKRVHALKNKLRNEADREVLTKYKTERDEIAQRKFKENGLEYTRRLTPSELAAKKVEDLIAENPELEAQLRARFAPADANEAPEQGDPDPRDEDSPGV